MLRANANFGELDSWVSGGAGRPAFTIMILKVEKLHYVEGRDLAALNSIVLEEEKTQDSGDPEQAW